MAFDPSNPSKLQDQRAASTVRPAPQKITDLNNPPNPLIENAKNNYASEFHHLLVNRINKFNASLDEAHEIGVHLVSFGQIVTLRLQGLDYSNPSLISFTGVLESGEPVELIQHVSQISILLIQMPRKDPSKPKQSFGFHVQPREENDLDAHKGAEQAT